MILIDTTPLVALCDERDPYHARAMRDLDRLSTKGGGFVTCTAVLTESSYHLSSPYGLRRLTDALKDHSIAPMADESTADVWRNCLHGSFGMPSTRRIWRMACLRCCRDVIRG